MCEFFQNTFGGMLKKKNLANGLLFSSNIPVRPKIKSMIVINMNNVLLF